VRGIPISMNNKNVRVVGVGLTGLVPLIVAVQSDMTNHYFAKSPIGSAAMFELIVGSIFDSSKLAHVLRRVELCHSVSIDTKICRTQLLGTDYVGGYNGDPLRVTLGGHRV
jgi:hypothetical protein